MTQHRSQLLWWSRTWERQRFQNLKLSKFNLQCTRLHAMKFSIENTFCKCDMFFPMRVQYLCISVLCRILCFGWLVFKMQMETCWRKPLDQSFDALPSLLGRSSWKQPAISFAQLQVNVSWWEKQSWLSDLFIFVHEVVIFVKTRRNWLLADAGNTCNTCNTWKWTKVLIECSGLSKVSLQSRLCLLQVFVT